VAVSLRRAERDPGEMFGGDCIHNLIPFVLRIPRSPTSWPGAPRQDRFEVSPASLTERG